MLDVPVIAPAPPEADWKTVGAVLVLALIVVTAVLIRRRRK